MRWAFLRSRPYLPAPARLLAALRSDMDRNPSTGFPASRRFRRSRSRLHAEPQTSASLRYPVMHEPQIGHERSHMAGWTLTPGAAPATRP